MISTDFAPNEQLDDAFLSLGLIFQPWLWKKGNALKVVKRRLESIFPNHTTYFFLTARSGLYNVLKGLHLPKNSEVIVQAFTCEAVILPILENKLKPVYCDIEAQTFSFNPIDLAKKITDKTKVVILQHSFGLIPRYRSQIQSIINRHNLVLIEDIAHGYNLSLADRAVANSTFLISFGRSKALSSVFGGAVITGDHRVQQSLTGTGNILEFPSNFFIFRLLLYKPLSVFIKSTYDMFLGKLIHKLTNMINLVIPEITKKEKSGTFDPLLNKAYPNALAVLLSHQLKKYERIVKHRARICDIYRKKIDNISLLRYPLLVKNPHSIREALAKHNIFLGNWYDQTVAPKSINFAKMQYKMGSCPTAEKVCKTILNLPTNLSHQEALKVLDFVK